MASRRQKAIGWTRENILKGVLCGLIALFIGINLQNYCKHEFNTQHIERSTVVIQNESGQLVGTGFIVSNQGHVMTADHVIRAFWDPKANKLRPIYVRAIGHPPIRVTPVANNSFLDMSLLYSEKLSNFDYLDIVTSEHVKAGDKIYVVGHPNGAAWSHSDGIVSRKSFVRTQYGTAYIIFITAWIDFGNSGGPVVNSDGDVICMVVAFLGPKNPFSSSVSRHTNLCVPGTEMIRLMETR